MIGVILCGGLSSRMGKDKGTLQLGKENWAQKTSENFMGLNIPFVISVNGTQKNIYEQIFDPKLIVVDNANINVEGPLLAMMSVYAQFPNEDIFVLACDMIDMDLPPLQHMLNKYLEATDYDTYIFETNKNLQPLCTIYTTKFLKNIASVIKEDKLERFSLKFLLKDFNNYVLNAPVEWTHYFNNYNSREDLIGNNKQV